MTKAKACKVAGENGSSGITPHVIGSVGKCEGMHLHIPKGASTLGIKVLVDFPSLESDCRGQKSMN